MGNNSSGQPKRNTGIATPASLRASIIAEPNPPPTLSSMVIIFWCDLARENKVQIQRFHKRALTTESFNQIISIRFATLSASDKFRVCPNRNLFTR